MKPIGEILLAQEWVELSILRRALARSRESGTRLCSYLISQGALAFDDASRALGEQHGVHAALQKHLDHRQQSLASVIPASLARACMALPLGHMGSGELIICVRDPSPALRAQLEHAVGDRVVLAIAPAQPLEALVAATYGEDDANEFDVDLGTGLVPAMEGEHIADDSLEMLSSLDLVELDDHGVSKEHALPEAGSNRNVSPAISRTQTSPRSDPLNPPTHRGALDPLNPPTHRGAVDPPTIRDAAMVHSAAPVVDELNPPTHRPQRSGLDAAGDVRVSRTVSRSGLDAAGVNAPRREPPRSGLHAAGDAPRAASTSGLHAAATPRARRPSGLQAAGDASPRANRPSALSAATEPAALTRATLEALAAGSVVPTTPPDHPPMQPVLSLDLDDDLPDPIDDILEAPRGTASPDQPAKRSPQPVPVLDDPPTTPTLTPPTPPTPPTTPPTPPTPLMPPTTTTAATTATPPSVDDGWATTPPPSTTITPAPSLVPMPAPSNAAVQFPPRPTTTTSRPAAAAALERAAAARTRTGPRAIDPAVILPRTVTPSGAIPSLVRPRGATLDTSALDQATTRGDAISAAIELARQRYGAGLLFELAGGTATGLRGFGTKVSDEAAQWMVLPLASRSIVAVAATTREPVVIDPDDHGELQKRLVSLIGSQMTAIAIAGATAPAFVFVVGDPLGDTDLATLAQLARALETAHARLPAD